MKIHSLYIKEVVFVLMVFSLLMPAIKAHGNNDKVRLVNLKGSWKFSIGEREEWIAPDFDDSNWESIFAPSPWEDQGFYGYNGFAFYRKEFTLSAEHEGKVLYLNLGFIDDVDEVYVNGEKIGSTGTFPPNYQTAYNAMRQYYLPNKVINFNKRNIIAIKVYDSHQAGGIVGGDIGIYSSRYDIKLDINLQGQWKFKAGDNLAYKEANYNDANWDQIFVPAKWEDQGYRDYDGYAWYRKSFTYNIASTDKNIILLLGKIDDIDQTYLNGELIGYTGEFSEIEGRWLQTNNGHYRALRGYYIPASKFKKGNNVIAVRVFDSHAGGGIYEGPVGIIPQSKYIEYWNNIRQYNK